MIHVYALCTGYIDILWNPSVMRDSLAALRTLRDRGAAMFYGHDPAQWDATPRAPAPVI